MRPTSPGAAPNYPARGVRVPYACTRVGVGGGEEEGEEGQGCASRLARQATRESVINTVTPETISFAIARLKRQLSGSTAGPFVMFSPKMGAYCPRQLCVTRNVRFPNYIYTPR